MSRVIYCISLGVSQMRFLAPILRLRSGRGPAAILFAKTPAQVLLGIPVGIPAHLKLFGCWDSKKLDLVYQKPSEDDD